MDKMDKIIDNQVTKWSNNRENEWTHKSKTLKNQNKPKTMQ